MTIASAVGSQGVSSNHERDPVDWYPTPPDVTQALLEAFPRLAKGDVCEPACGDGSMARVIRTYGAYVVASDLHDHGYGRTGINFLDVKPGATFINAIITNPPFNLAAEFIEHARTFNVPVAMLLKATFWNVKRNGLFERHKPSHICPLTWRPNFKPERGSSPTMDVIWTVWMRPDAKITKFQPLYRPGDDRQGSLI